MNEKAKELGNKFTNHCKILEKIQDDLMYIHQTVKLIEGLQKETTVTLPNIQSDN